MCTFELCKLTLVTSDDPHQFFLKKSRFEGKSLSRVIMSVDCFLKAKDEKKTVVIRAVRVRVPRLSDCNDEIRNHLISCHLSKEALSENELILAGFLNLAREDVARMWICFRHRHTLGKFWRSSKVICQYPQHSGENKRVKGRDVVNLQMAQDIQKLFGGNVPEGSGSFFRDFVHSGAPRRSRARSSTIVKRNW